MLPCRSPVFPTISNVFSCKNRRFRRIQMLPRPATWPNPSPPPSEPLIPNPNHFKSFTNRFRRPQEAQNLAFFVVFPMTCSVFASAVFTTGGVGWGNTRAATGFLGLQAKFSAGFGRASFGDQGLSFLSFRVPGLEAKGKRTPGVAYATAATEKSVHDFTVKDIDGKDISLSKFKGKILLIVNVASQCGLTRSNYTELSHLYEKYKNQGFEILAFPCNQFGGQEPGSNPEIKQFACTKFKAEFPIFDKVDVNGPKTAPIYQFLKASAGGFLGDLIKWNFEKFLIDKNGKVVERYPPTTSPFQIEKDIKKLLAA